MSTSQNSAIFSRTPSVISWSDRHTMKSGCTPKLRSSFTECWVASSSPRGCGDVRHERHVDEQHVARPHLLLELARRLDEGQALDVADGAADFRDDNVAPDCSAARRIRSLMASVTCGMTCTVPPRKSPRRSRAMSVCR